MKLTAPTKSGKRFGILFVGRTFTIKGVRWWVCECECGRVKAFRDSNLQSGNTKSCGCIKPQYAKSRLTHGMTGTRTHQSWLSMKSRCLNPKVHNYKYYGSRGIKVCKRWMKFENFFADMGERPAGMTLERKNRDGNYELGNCVWATRTEQARNKSNTRFITAFGLTRPLASWAEKAGLSYSVFKRRIQRGWTTQRALSQPVRGKTK